MKRKLFILLFALICLGTQAQVIVKVNNGGIGDVQASDTNSWLATQYQLATAVGITYPGAGIPLSTGAAWGTSITNNSTNWNTAYTDRLKWDGGATGLTAATARTSLGATTIGKALFMLVNPHAVAFLRINVDSTISAQSAADFKTSLSLNNVTNKAQVEVEDSAITYTTPYMLDTTYAAISEGGGTVLADNGLTKSGNTIKLGDTLTEPTIIVGDTTNTFKYRQSNPTTSVEMGFSTSNYASADYEWSVIAYEDIDFDFSNNRHSWFALKTQHAEFGFADPLGTGERVIAIHNTGMVVKDDYASTGLTYLDDYSANFSDRSLVDKEYVDNIITTTDSNFVTVTGDTIRANTIITPDTDGGAVLGDALHGFDNLFFDTLAVINFNNGDVTLTHALNTLTLGGGNLALGSNSLTMTGSLAATSSRVLKGWFTDLEITNSPTVGGTSIALIYAPIASPTHTGTTTSPTFAASGAVNPSGPLDATGYQIKTVASTITDSFTPGTRTLVAANGFATPTFAGDNSVTLTNAATFYIATAPAAGTNITITNPYSLYIADGNSRVADTLKVESGINIGNARIIEAELEVLDGVPATLTATELGYVDGVTSAIQTQLNAINAELDDTFAIETTIQLNSDSTWTIDFPFGSGQPGDTTLFANNAIAGVHHWPSGDTIIIRGAIGVLAEGSGTETISIQMSSHATFKSGSATNLFSSAQAITSITTGTVITTFANATIYPDTWSWLTLSGVIAGRKPTMLGLTFYYSKQNRAY